MLRAARGVRASLVAAVLLAAFGTASMLDGEAADFVGGDDGDALVTRRQEEASLSASAAPRAPDVCSASRRTPFLAALRSPALAGRATSALADRLGPAGLDRFVTSPPLPSRAPPAL